MRKKQEIKLSIPTPCHESWDNMTLNEKGRYCSNCNKTVIDFSLYTDKELVEFFKAAKPGSVCGRINTYQANRAILVTEQNNRTLFHKLFLGSALASWLGFGTAQAQQNTPSLTVKQTSSAHHTQALKSVVPTTSSTCRVTGKVTDKHRQPISGVTISIMSHRDDTTAIMAESDSLGNFSADIPIQYLNRKMVILSDYGAYKESETHFTVKKSQYFNIELKEDPRPHIVGRLMF